MDERWMPVYGFEGAYEVSDMGRVKSIDRKITARNGRGSYLRRGLFLHGRPASDEQGRDHLKVALYKDRKRTDKAIHLIVLETFVGPCPEGMQARHLDGDTRFNTLKNLRWGTPQQNMDDRERHGRTARGERVGRSVLTAADVLAIRKAKAEGQTTRQLAAAYGINSGHVSRVCTGKIWSHL